MEKRSDLHYYELLTAALSEQPKVGSVLIKEYFSAHTISDAVEKGSFLIRNLNIPITKLLKRLDELEVLLRNSQVYILPIWSEKYPRLLKETYDPPACLYYRGDLDILANKLISVVGTRRVTKYGISTTKSLVNDLVERNFIIVSGMAMGVDAAAHQATLDSNGKTIAVLVGGPHKPTPAINRNIYENIIEKGGLVISENLPGTKIFSAMFPSRNRIVAGISGSTLVVEADEKSGSLITAELALDFDRDVFAVPGPITSKESRGTNSLIKKGHAKLISSVNDILEELGMEVVSLESRNLKQNLTPLEVSIYDLLSDSAKTIDELQILLSKERGVILSLCTRLEFKNIIYRDISGRYNLV